MGPDQEIAIVGIGCRFPGADNLEEYWRVLVNGENHVLDIPKERWNNEAFYSENKDEVGKHYVKRAGFLKNHDEWDHKLFGVNEREAVKIEPQQRYVLECTHMAMEDGGITRADLKGSQTGVYIGVMNDDYKGLVSSDHNDDTNYSATGMSTTIIASRVSYTYDLQGPCMVIDTACSSSIIAIHLGCQAIRTGDCETAICGGVNSIISPDTFFTLCKARMMSAVGQCQTFCDTADGYARGEGCGVVILKSVKRALEDGNKIWAILGTGSNQDGHATTPITAPSGDQQEILLHKVYNQYGVDPTMLQYIEAHGTGTPIGDPTEINALGKFISRYRPEYEQKNKAKSQNKKDNTIENEENDNGKEIKAGKTTDLDKEIDKTKETSYVQRHQECLILVGSVKTNIGHTESASGVAALIKVLLMMKNGKFVPSLHLKKDKSNLNRNLKLDEYKLDIALNVEDWDPNMAGERLCCVNSFGFGGSNSHAIVIQRKYPNTVIAKEPTVIRSGPYNIFCMSAEDTTALKNTLQHLGNSLQDNIHSLSDIAYTCAFRRDHFTNRTLVFGKNVEELVEQIRGKAKTIDRMKSPTKTRVIFVFCGVGTTWTGMCAEMMRTQPVFKAKINEIDHYLKPLTGWRIAEKFEKEDTDYSDQILNHIAIFSSQIALFAMWDFFGITPDVIVGQSVGEVAASVASGALSLKDGVSVIFHRSTILADITGGRMMVVGNIPVKQIEEICNIHENKVTIAVYSSPNACTLSGDADVMDDIKQKLEYKNDKDDAGILIRPLSVQCAYHSHHVASCIEEIEQKLQHISKGQRIIDQISTVSGEFAINDEFQIGKYWADNIRQPVKFSQSLIQASKTMVTNVFVELGPRQVLHAHLPNIMGEKLNGECLPSMNVKKENICMFSSLNDLYEMGMQIKLENIVPAYGTLESIPRYVFNKSKILYIPETTQQSLKGVQGTKDTHLYVRPTGSDKAEFRIEVDKETTPFVYDHFFLNAILVPGATYVEAAFEVGQKKSRYTAYELAVSVDFIHPFTPTDGKQYLIEIEVTEDFKHDGYEYRTFRDGQTLCQGSISGRKEPERPTVDIEVFRQRCKTYRSKEESYKCLEKTYYNYGKSLSLIMQSWSSATECVAELIVPNSVKVQTKNTHIHPSIIDAMFQTFGILSTEVTIRGQTLPRGAGSVILNRPPQERMFCYSQMVKSTAIGNHFNCLLLSPEGYVIAEVNDFYTKTIGESDASNKSIVYDLAWNSVDVNEQNEEIEKEARVVKRKTTGKVLVFGSNRFNKCFMPMKDKANAELYELDDSLSYIKVTLRKAFDQIPNARAVIFAACHHIQQSKNADFRVYDQIKVSFMSLAFLIQLLKENDYMIPIFVITENVIANPDMSVKASNICGGELWGMVRSAMAETAYNDIRIVDMSLTWSNAKALELLTKPDSPNHNEYLINDGLVYSSEMIEAIDQDHEPNRRELDINSGDELVLKSSHPMKVVIPHYQLNKTKTKPLKTRISSLVTIRLQVISLHDSIVYPTSTESEYTQSTIWPESNDNGFQVVALEGLGSIESIAKKTALKKKKCSSVGFCCPINVSSTVDVPSKCVFEVENIPAYVPGIMTTSVLLWHLAEECKHSSNILIIIDEEQNVLSILFKNMLTKYKKDQVTTETKDAISNVKSVSRSCVHTVVVLSKVTQTHVDMLQISCPNLQNIISIEAFFERHLQRWIFHNMKETSVIIKKTEEMFSLPELTNKVPKIQSWLKSLDISVQRELKDIVNCEEKTDKETRPFRLPYLTLQLDESHVNYNPIPLKVLRSEIFRPNGCYILVGGLTGLGWELMEVMAEHGAGYLVTFSRRPLIEEKRQKIYEMEIKYKCNIITVQVDITNFNELRKELEGLESRICEANIKGVFHGGSVLADMLLSKMTMEEAEKALQPKVLGTWNLHLLTKDMQLDFFVMHSSIASILGNQGQCNYAAGNSFQDSFAHYRRSLGLCGQSINWSTLSLGMATENKEVEKHFRSQGFTYLSIDVIKSCFIRAVMTNPPQVTFGIFDWSRLEALPIVKMYPHKFVRLRAKYGMKNQSFQRINSKTSFEMEVFSKVDPDKQREMIMDLLKPMITDTIVGKKVNLDEDSRLVTLGIDSMDAMSFTNFIFETTQVRIPVVIVLSGATTIGSIATYILENMSCGSLESKKKAENQANKLFRFLEGNVTFMQYSLLKDFVKNPCSHNFIRQADFEVKGLNLKPKDWKVVLNHVLKMNPELRRVYTLDKENNLFDSRLLSADEVDVDMEVVPFDSICDENATDDREKNIFDLTKDLPIRFKIACKKDKTRMRLYMHSVISDLSGIALLFNDIGSYMKMYISNKAMPEKETDIVPAECIRTALSPRMTDLKQYWKLQLSQDVQPFTFSDDIEKELYEKHWCQIRHDIPKHLVDSLLQYIQKTGSSLYNFVMSVYMAFLHGKTGKELIPIVTNVDMRGHVPQLKSFVTRCINTIPVIGDLRNIGTVGDYLQRSSDRFLYMTQQGGFPYELIEEEMQTDALRKHIGRHRLVMDSMAKINQTFKHNRLTVKVMNVFHKRHVYETSLYVLYDLKEGKVTLEYGYNSESVKHEDAAEVPLKLVEMMQTFIECETAEVFDVLQGNRRVCITKL